MFTGAIVAIVTPFKDGKVDEEALRELIEFQIESGTDGIVPCGTTGESATMSHEEHDRVVEITVDAVNKRVPVIAGAGSNSTKEAIRLTEHAYKVGADGTLLVTPYNVPGRTGVNILPETAARLSKISNIVAIKEATGDLKQVSKVVELCGDDLAVLSGDDFTVLPILAVGGKGVISRGIWQP